MTISILMVAEKPAAAKAIAEGLSHQTSKNSHAASGRGSIPVWEFDGTFENRAAHFKVTSTTGHVFERDFVETHRSWNSDPLQLFDAETIKSECKEGGKIIKTLVNAAKGCSFLILWLDCDREGENICFEVIQIVQSHLLPLPSVIRQILRAKFSSLDAKDVKKAFQSLVLPDKNISDSVEARQEIDLKIGCAFTRFQTRFFQEKYGDLNATVLSYGPCQTPTLYFCVERYDEIQNFEAETYFKLNVLLKAGEMEISLRWQRGVVFDEAVATLYKELVESSTTIATVHSVHEEAEIRRKVLPLDTCTFLKKSSSLCQIGPHTAMQIAERLYLSQIITYPRTETSVYPSSFPLLETAKLFQNHPILGESTRELLKNGLQKARQGVDAQDHPPITPLKLISREFLGNENEWKLYDMICRHFLASVSGDCHFRKQKIIFEISSEIFSSTKRRLIDRGFTVFTPIPENNEGFLPLLIKGDKLVISKVFISKHQTAPPPCLSESDLIELMRKNGIGTDASIPQHINNIQERNYVSLVANRRLQPSKLGLSIIHGFSSVDRELILPHVRAAIEASISIIAEGRASMIDVVHHSLSMFKKKFEYFRDNIATVDNLFEVSFTRLADSGNLFSRCGHCKRYMTFIPKEPIRLFCKHCNVTYRMPSGGTIKLYQELKCPLDEFELVFFTKKDGKTFPLCPLCYCFPPFESYDGSSSKMNCLQCMHPTCSHSYRSQAIAECPQEACNGTLCLEVLSRPKWKMECNCCPLQIKFFEDAKKISLTGKRCETCEYSLLFVSYSPTNSPWKDGSNEKVGCIQCTEEFQSLVKGTSFSKMCGRRGGGRRYRRGRRGGGPSKRMDPRMTFSGF